MHFFLRPFTAEKLISYLKSKGSLEQGLKKYPWGYLEKGEGAKLFGFCQNVEPGSRTAFLVLSYLVYAPQNVWLKAKAALLILGHPLLTLTERKVYLDVIQELLTRVQGTGEDSERSNEASKVQFLQARFYEETAKYLSLVDQRQNALVEYQKALALYQTLEKRQKVEKISAEMQNLESEIHELALVAPAIEEQVKLRQQELAIISARLEMIQGQQAQVDAELADQRAELSQVQAQIAAAQAELLTTQNELQTHRASLTEHQAELEKKAAISSSLAQQISEQETMLAAQKEQVLEQQQQKAQLDELLTGLQQTITDLESKKSILMQTLAPFIQEQVDLMAIRDETNQLRAERKGLEAEIFKLQNRMKASQQRLEQQEKEEISLTDTWGQVREQVDALKMKRDQLLLEIEQLEGQKRD